MNSPWVPKVAPSIESPEAEIRSMSWEESQEWCNFVLMKPTLLPDVRQHGGVHAPEVVGGNPRPHFLERLRERVLGPREEALHVHDDERGFLDIDHDRSLVLDAEKLLNHFVFSHGARPRWRVSAALDCVVVLRDLETHAGHVSDPSVHRQCD